MWLIVLILYLIPAAIVFVAGMQKAEELDYQLAPYVRYNLTVAMALSFGYILTLALLPGFNAVFASRLAKRNGWL